MTEILPCDIRGTDGHCLSLFLREGTPPEAQPDGVCPGNCRERATAAEQKKRFIKEAKAFTDQVRSGDLPSS